MLENAPRIRDVEAMCRLLQGLGAEVEGIGTSTLRVRCREVRTTDPDPALVARIRGSVLLIAPLVARAGRAAVGEPGGDFPGRRSVATHYRALAALGAFPETPGGRGLAAPEGLRGASFYLDEASVTATETALLAAATASGTTEIRNAAGEPHVAELARFLRRMGADVAGEGTSTLRVTGVARLSGATPPDRRRLHRGRQLGGRGGGHGRRGRGSGRPSPRHGADRRGALPLRRAHRARRGPPPGARVHARGRRRVTTGVWPGFPSDMVSLVTVLATQARGSTLIHDWLYELRLFALEQMSGMGADLFLCDPHRIVVTGPRRLRRRTLDSRDIRSGMALVVAALAAEGSSRIEPLETIERGYARLVERLRGLGATVEREG